MLLATIDARRFVPVRISTPFPGCDEYNVGMCVIGYGYHTGGVRGRTPRAAASPKAEPPRGLERDGGAAFRVGATG
jgi:hypothetical protein